MLPTSTRLVTLLQRPTGDGPVASDSPSKNGRSPHCNPARCCCATS